MIKMDICPEGKKKKGHKYLCKEGLLLLLFIAVRDFCAAACLGRQMRGF
jgi:hypothetical protein